MFSSWFYLLFNSQKTILRSFFFCEIDCIRWILDKIKWHLTPDWAIAQMEMKEEKKFTQLLYQFNAILTTILPNKCYFQILACFTSQLTHICQLRYSRNADSDDFKITQFENEKKEHANVEKMCSSRVWWSRFRRWIITSYIRLNVYRVNKM